jgi:hypothetical protein
MNRALCVPEANQSAATIAGFQKPLDQRSRIVDAAEVQQRTREQIGVADRGW